MDQEFALPIQVAYLTLVLLVLIIWYIYLFLSNRKASAAILPVPIITKSKKYLAYISGAVIISMITIDYYNLYIAIFWPSQKVSSAEFNMQIIQSANNVLLYFGLFFAGIIPLLIMSLITASQFKSGLLAELSNKELINRQKENYLKYSKISVYSIIQGINWIMILLGLQYFVVNSFWQGYVTMCIILNILMQIIKTKLKKELNFLTH